MSYSYETYCAKQGITPSMGCYYKDFIKIMHETGYVNSGAYHEALEVLGTKQQYDTQRRVEQVVDKVANKTRGMAHAVWMPDNTVKAIFITRGGWRTVATIPFKQCDNTHNIAAALKRQIDGFTRTDIENMTRWSYPDPAGGPHYHPQESMTSDIRELSQELGKQIHQARKKEAIL